MRAAISFRTESGDDYLFCSYLTSPVLIAEDIVAQFGDEFAWAWHWEVVTDPDIDKDAVVKWIRKLHAEAQEEHR